jgi:cytochrome c peroxidase
MNLTFKELEKRLKADPEYPALFEKAFPKAGINKKNISEALATFIRGIVSYKAPFDLWIEGNEKAISQNAKNGFLIFNTKAKCVRCHTGWRFTDDNFYDIGLNSPDIGRGIIDKNFNYAFKTPSLREISKRNPYMHDSSIATLEDVIEYFNKGGHRKLMRPLRLTVQEKKDLMEFLKTLFSLKKENIPPLIHRELYLSRERSKNY